MHINRVTLFLTASTPTWAAIGLTAADQPQISTLVIETDNVVTYVGDVNDPAKLALTAGATTPAATRAFTESITIGDVVKVNGKPAKGLRSSRGYAKGFSDGGRRLCHRRHAERAWRMPLGNPDG